MNREPDMTNPYGGWGCSKYMKSITLYTEEIDDLNEAMDDLVSQAEGFELEKNTLGIFFAEEELDYSELYNLLSMKWGFPIIGSTVMAMLTTDRGYCSTGMSLMILTGDDVEFSAGITEEMDIHNYKQEMEKTYKELKSKLSSPEKLVLSYGGPVYTEEDVAGDLRVDELSRLSNGAYVYGASSSDGFTFGGSRVFYNEKIVKQGQAIALISGNIDPHFIRINSVGDKAPFQYEITKSEGNRIYKVGDISFVEALEKEGMKTGKHDVLGDYILSPFAVTIKKENGDGVEVTRNLSVLNAETGAGSFMGNMPEGSMINIGLINRGELKSTLAQAFTDLFEKREKGELSYNTLICSSCVARFMGLASNTLAEGETFLGRLPQGVSLIGMYAYGEYCPSEGSKTGKLYNTFHNYTFSILAL